MKISILAAGKVREDYLKQGIAEYSRRLAPLAKIEIWETEDEPLPESASAAQAAQAREREGERLLRQVPEGAFCVALDSGGELLSSPELAETIRMLDVKGVRQVVFCIGGSTGLSPAVLARADLRLSFGKVTYPHQMMRLILLEQIYRACKINRGEPYHK
ncbi:MAG: 23S rRNA (pseudouridine(1915)-N(3))-methyltransferase RlmH [Clostridiales bacterium]|nr:23S rRNA (pseudouridine(1915)-N(3))-methyltransferase RlmH [Clostridiales bacterium]